jgi:protein phosphatase
MAAPLVVEIPDPSLIVLVGAAGAGKSTFAGRWFDAAEILSSDAFRAHLGRDAADQSVTRLAFGVLHKALERRLAQAQLTVVDATNVDGQARRALTRRAHAARVPSIAIVLALPSGIVLARNALRPGRIVPLDVVRAQLAALERGLARDRFANDGFARVELILDVPTLDRLRLERRPSPPNVSPPERPPA